MNFLPQIGQLTHSLTHPLIPFIRYSLPGSVMNSIPFCFVQLFWSKKRQTLWPRLGLLDGLGLTSCCFGSYWVVASDGDVSAERADVSLCSIYLTLRNDLAAVLQGIRTTGSCHGDESMTRPVM